MPAHRPTVADAMLVSPVVSMPTATAGDVRALLADEHRHAALLVDGDRLVAVLLADDVAGVPDDQPARALGALEGRTVAPGTALEPTRTAMLRAGRRRLAVVDDGGRLLGLLCLQHHGRGFCTAETVAERAADRD